MIRHITLIDFKEDATQEQKDEALQAFRQLPQHIPGILEFQVGLDLGLLEGNAGLAVQATFANREAFITYSRHEAHGSVVFPVCGPIMAGYSTAQFEG
ncbi:Dabb family protein [Haliea sp. E1-2-M8]|uniref:Dabb family protein n=1 Tax=Haliea sp. E1-2-M8 TaxID=3064706 RepID=UPI0027163B34|nr:Dabb family protein [Haliea sp. E1-2-M8]MDO8863017.1 Dabb family protein [Haliea sp. E1-2-M8]